MNTAELMDVMFKASEIIQKLMLKCSGDGSQSYHISKKCNPKFK